MKSENVVRSWISLSLICGNLFTFIVILTLWIIGGFSNSEFKQLILLMTPLLFAYATPVIKYIISSRSDIKPDDNFVNNMSFWVIVMIPITVQLITISLCIIKSFNIGIQSFDDLQLALGSIQTIFGAFIGLVVSTLFGPKLSAQ